MEEKMKNLKAIVGEMAETIWSIPQSSWFDWANHNLEFVQSNAEEDMVKYVFHHNGYANLEPFRMIVWVSPYNWGYQEAIIRGLKTQIEVDLF